MTISYTTEERLPLLEYGSSGWDTVINGAFEDWDEGKHLYLQAGENIAQYDVVCIEIDGKMYKAQATDDTLLPGRGIAPEAVTSGSYGRIVIFGHITNAGWTFNIAAPVYVSASVAGALTQTKPELAQIIGYAKTATQLVVMPNPEREYLIVVDDDGEVVTDEDGEVVYS